MNKSPSFQIIMLGLSITSSWGNGHASTYRGLIREMEKRGHRLLFLERDVPQYAGNRDLPEPPYCKTVLYQSIEELQDCYTNEIRRADLVLVGSFVPEGVSVCKWVLQNASNMTAFYDIDTPVTMAKLNRKEYDYLSPDFIRYFDIYLSFTGGPVLNYIERKYGSPMARALYCSVDPELYFAKDKSSEYDFGYLGTFSHGRQPALEEIFLKPAQQWPEGKFIIAGAQYPENIKWPVNVRHTTHLSSREHRGFYNSQHFTLNITRPDMVRAGYSPSVRLFEAAACATPVISDYWQGLETFFVPNKEILISHSASETLDYLTKFPEESRLQIGQAARQAVLAKHTSAHRAAEFEKYMMQALYLKYKRKYHFVTDEDKKRNYSKSA